MSGKTTRKVTVETSNRLSTDTSSLSITTEQGSKMKKRSVFERLGTAGVSYESSDKLCRTFLREGDCPYGKKCKYSHDIDQDSKRNRKSDKLYMDREADYDHYENVRKSPEKKKDKRKFLDADKLKIEFKKDSSSKNKQNFEDVYEDEIPQKRSKKDKKDKGESTSLHSKVKKGYDEDVMVEKKDHVRNVQLKGEEKKEKKSGRSSETVKDDEFVSQSKKAKKKKYQDESEEESKYKEKVETSSLKKKKKKKDKAKYSSSESESEDDKMKKKKSKKDKYKSYESDESSSSKKKKKNVDNEKQIYEKQMEMQSGMEQKKKKKKKKEKYESENDEESDENVYSKSEKAHEEDRSKKSGRHIEEDEYAGKASQHEHGKKKSKSKSTHSASPKIEKSKEHSRRSDSWSGESESGNEFDDDVIDKKSSKKSKNQEKGYKEEKKKEKDKKIDKYDDSRVWHRRSYEDSKESNVHDERKRDYKSDTHGRDHYPQQQQQHHSSTNQEGSYESWDRDRSSYDDRGHRGTPVTYGRGRGQSSYRSRYDAHSKDSEDRQQYRQYSEQQYPADDARYRSRGGRDDYGHHSYRRGYQDDEEGYQGGRSRDFYQGYSQGSQSDDRHRYRGDYPSGKELEGSSQMDRKKERKDHSSRSPNARRRTRSPFEGEEEGDVNRGRTKKRKRDHQSVEKDQSLERKGKKLKTDSDVQSGSDDEMKTENRKHPDRDKRSKAHREAHYKRDDTGDERRDRRSDKGSRERDRRYKRGSSTERSRRERHSSRSEKREESPSRDDSQGSKIEDKRVKELRTSHGRNSPSERSDSETKTQKRSSSNKGRSNTNDGSDVNLDDVYEKISDEELDFFDEENSKSQKPASLEDVDWSALAAIAPTSKRDKEDDTSSLMAKHSAINVLRTIGLSSNLLSKKALEMIKEKANNDNKENENKDKLDFIDFRGTGALVLSKIRHRQHRRNLICGLNDDGNVLSMRKDIDIRKELSFPPQKLGMNGSLYCRAPSSPADRELFLASASLFKKIPPGEEKSSCKIIPSLIGSVIQCCT